MKLRDHMKPCEHAPDDYRQVFGDGFHIGHDYYYMPAHSAWCPGGREVVFRQVDYWDFPTGDDDLMAEFRVWWMTDDPKGEWLTEAFETEDE